MYLITEDETCGLLLCRVVFMDGRSCEAEINGMLESGSYGNQHIPEHRTVGLVDNDDDAFLVDFADIPVVGSILLNSAHLLDRSDYQLTLIVFEQ